jgi:tetratricopeptide (TPR) repeat protein
LSATLMARQAKFCFSLEHHEEAGALLTEGRQLIHHTEADHILAFIEFVDGILNDVLGEYELAKTKLTLSLTLYQKMEDLFGQIVLLNNLGILGFNQGVLDEATDFYEQGLSLCQQTGDRFSLARVYNNLGNISFFGKQDYPQAKAYYEKALPIFQEVGSLMGEQFAWGNLGAAASHMHELEEARAWFEQALVVGRKVGTPSILINTLANLADIEFQIGKHDAEFPYLEEALSIANATGLPALIMTAGMFVSRYVREVGDANIALRWLIFLHRDHPHAYMQEYAKGLLDELMSNISKDELDAAQLDVADWGFEDFCTDMNNWMNAHSVSATRAERQ